MLTSRLGIRLLLWIGKTVPRPASPGLLRAIRQIEVSNQAAGDDGFRITFSLAREKTGEFDLLQDDALEPDSRVIIGVIMGAAADPLMDGIVHHHQLAPGDQPGTSTLTVMGRDLRVLMSLKEVNRKFPNLSDSAIVEQILRDYALYGLRPEVTSTTDASSETERIPWQQEDDLTFINRLAERNGHVFYVEPLSIGASTAYWGPRQRSGQSQPALSYNLGAASNVQRIQFRNDALAPITVQGRFTDPTTKQSLSIPAVSEFGESPLANQQVKARRTVLMRDTGERDAAGAASARTARVRGAPDPVDCSGTLDAVRYGHVLRARRVVGLRGVGRTYDGSYYVQSVKHLLTLTSYTQEFGLQREGTGALLPVVGTT